MSTPTLESSVVDIPVPNFDSMSINTPIPGPSRTSDKALFDIISNVGNITGLAVLDRKGRLLAGNLNVEHSQFKVIKQLFKIKKASPIKNRQITLGSTVYGVIDHNKMAIHFSTVPPELLNEELTMKEIFFSCISSIKSLTGKGDVNGSSRRMNSQGYIKSYHPMHTQMATEHTSVSGNSLMSDDDEFTEPQHSCLLIERCGNNYILGENTKLDNRDTLLQQIRDSFEVISNFATDIRNATITDM
ncbi:hypothetical protein SAMD00019534_091880 [Acytostelium subglobosum LB1]|uniref:hypothetical protein n=1 Tax=Acytostelium subglobosum LB1 TaxID=1410327 RepID=UPI000644DC11|nr:hypothetical protein SAMD00019534_091880 [Acytostelium subglobosum LB1]GAM26013.1 hypothetical protein SAMD00019534_091880 [Acytostelium subglobosum LB1]|eukprot:XP_012751056.1 hypothetical protein SAMD00019534_091880 [Acytostelium subglobosum LB1]